MLHLKLFGAPSIESNDGPIAGRAAQGRQLALLAVLALARGRPVRRDRLIGLLWPDSPVDRARAQLSDTVYVIRSALGHEVIRSSGDELELRPDVVTSDVGTFEQLIEERRFAPAVKLITGPLLDGFHVTDAVDFEHWLDAERARTSGFHALALESLAEAAEADDDYPAAVGWWRRLASHSPYSGRVSLRLMRALDATGDRAGALQHARMHALLLREEFEAEPDPEVVALAERLRLEPPARPTNEPVPIRAALAPGQDAVASTPANAQRVANGTAEPDTDHAATPRVPRDRLRFARPNLAVTLVTLTFLVAGSILAVRGMRLGLPATGYSFDGDAATASTPPRTAPARSVAVLPFVNLSPDPGEEYLSDGLADELIGSLARIRSLRVAARTSSFAFKGKAGDIRQIGEALNVGTVLEGSVRQTGDRVQVLVQLIDVTDGFHLWSESYERSVTEILDIQRDVTVQVSIALAADLTSEERDRLATRPTRNPEAHTSFLKGRHFLSQRIPASYQRAIEHFQRAIALDPDYGAAHSGLAGVYLLQGLAGTVTDASARELAVKAAVRAIELDASNADAHAALGLYLHAYEWDVQEAERAFVRSIALDPYNTFARQSYGNLLGATRRLDEAIEQKRIAVELDPLVPALYETLAFTLVRAGHLAEAAHQLAGALELDSTYWRAHAVAGLIHELQDNADAAIRAYETANALARASTHRTRPDIARVLAGAGRPEEARRLLAGMRTEAEASGMREPSVATVLLALGDSAAAFAWLEHGLRQKHPHFAFIAGDPRFAGFDHDPRFADLMRRAGIWD